ncbi:hypothetical protein QL285_061199 [Trifolium repens]|nr:hypothetical protein QL285_061199 [Trifolium repens]
MLIWQMISLFKLHWLRLKCHIDIKMVHSSHALFFKSSSSTTIAQCSISLSTNFSHAFAFLTKLLHSTPNPSNTT